MFNFIATVVTATIKVLSVFFLVYLAYKALGLFWKLLWLPSNYLHERAHRKSDAKMMSKLQAEFDADMAKKYPNGYTPVDVNYGTVKPKTTNKPTEFVSAQGRKLFRDPEVKIRASDFLRR
jgi:hypothetical protein